MPHDAKGRPLQKGDRVTMEFEVREVWPSETACNVNLVGIDPCGCGESPPGITCNSKFATKLEAAIPATERELAGASHGGG